MSDRDLAVQLHPGVPGVRRNTLIDPRPGVVRADVEDDFHRFWVELAHDGETITNARSGAERFPWTTCPAAGLFLASRLIGVRLDEAAKVDPIYSHCTHMFDLAMLAAAHALEDEPMLVSMFVGDVLEPTRRAELWRDGKIELAWDMEESTIVEPADWAGRNLRKLKEWEGELTPRARESAHMLRRAIFISGGRGMPLDRVPDAAAVTQSVGACYTFQPERSKGGKRMRGSTRNFSDGPMPLDARVAKITP